MSSLCVQGNSLGPQYAGDLLVGGSRTSLYGGYLFRLKLAADRRSLVFTDGRLNDRVADNHDKYDITESESLLIGRDFGITAEIQTAPNGNVYVVSLSNGAIYEIHSTSKFFLARLNGAQEVPANNSRGAGTAVLQLSEDETTAQVSLVFSGLTGTPSVSHIHGPGTAGENAGVLFDLPANQFANYPINLTPMQVENLRAGRLSINVRSSAFPDGEIRRTINIPILDDTHIEGSESLSVTLGNASGAELGGAATAALTITDNDTASAPNAVDNEEFFVRGHYLDFLNREPEPTGFNAWLGVLNKCQPVQVSCDCIEVSSSFFRSTEFQDRGYFVYRFYATALGRLPLYEEFMPDLRRVTGYFTLEQLEASKRAFINDFVNRAEFKEGHDALTPAAFVDALAQMAGVTLGNRDQLIGELQTGTKTRGQVLREVSESKAVSDKFFNTAFVVMQYFGYLRRDPDVLYMDWIRVLNETGDFRVMVNGFVNSIEYRTRFGQP